jgi:hypothetical protein
MTTSMTFFLASKQSRLPSTEGSQDRDGQKKIRPVQTGTARKKEANFQSQEPKPRVRSQPREAGKAIRSTNQILETSERLDKCRWEQRSAENRRSSGSYPRGNREGDSSAILSPRYDACWMATGIRQRKGVFPARPSFRAEGTDVFPHAPISLAKFQRYTAA